MRLEKIVSKTAKTGANYNCLTIDGKTYNYFGEMGDIKVGDEVVCEFETKGKYTNLKSIVKGQAFSNSASTQSSFSPLTSPQSNVILTRTDKPHSFEFGKASQRHKIYYNTVQELKAHIMELVNSNLAMPLDFAASDLGGVLIDEKD